MLSGNRWINPWMHSEWTQWLHCGKGIVGFGY